MPPDFSRLRLPSEVRDGGDHGIPNDHGGADRRRDRDRQIFQLCRDEVALREDAPAAEDDLPGLGAGVRIGPQRVDPVEKGPVTAVHRAYTGRTPEVGRSGRTCMGLTLW